MLKIGAIGLRSRVAAGLLSIVGVITWCGTVQAALLLENRELEQQNLIPSLNRTETQEPFTNVPLEKIEASSEFEEFNAQFKNYTPTNSTATATTTATTAERAVTEGFIKKGLEKLISENVLSGLVDLYGGTEELRNNGLAGILGLFSDYAGKLPVGLWVAYLKGEISTFSEAVKRVGKTLFANQKFIKVIGEGLGIGLSDVATLEILRLIKEREIMLNEKLTPQQKLSAFLYASSTYYSCKAIPLNKAGALVFDLVVAGYPVAGKVFGAASHEGVCQVVKFITKKYLADYSSLSDEEARQRMASGLFVIPQMLLFH